MLRQDSCKPFTSSSRQACPSAWQHLTLEGATQCYDLISVFKATPIDGKGAVSHSFNPGIHSLAPRDWLVPHGHCTALSNRADVCSGPRSPVCCEPGLERRATYANSEPLLIHFFVKSFSHKRANIRVQRARAPANLWRPLPRPET
jgi:hypothetical protein